MTHLGFLVPVVLMFLGFLVLLMGSLLRQRRFGQELRQSEARYHGLFENSPISLWEEDFSEVKMFINGLRDEGITDFRAYFEVHPEAVENCARMVKVIDVNKATLKLYNANNKKNFFRDLRSFFGKEIHKAFREELLAIANDKTSFESEDFNETFTGEKKDIFLRWTVVPGFEEEYSRVLVSIIDITDQRLADQALRESEKRYRDLVENISEIYFVCDERGMVLYGSPNFFTDTGYLPGEIIGKPFFRLIASEDRGRVIEFYRARTADGTLDTTCEFRGRRKDGSVTWVEQSTRIIRDSSGKAREYRNVVRNITERKNAENELVVREKRFRALIEESSDVIALIGSDGVIRYVGPSVGKVLGYSVEELSGRSTIDLIHPLDKGSVEHMLEIIFKESGAIGSVEARLKHRNGSWCWVEGIAKNLVDEPAVNAIVVNFRDISDRRATAEMLRQLPMRIINAQESERRRVARDLHDGVNQILSSVKFRMENVEAKVRLRNGALHREVTSAKHSLERVMNEVRRISRNLRPSELDDLGVIPAVRSMCEEFEEATKIIVDLKFTRIPEKLSPAVEVTMYRIIQEALTNASKHSEATRLTIHCAKGNSSLRIRIKDNGKGFDQRGQSVGAPRTIGTGLLNMKERAAHVGGTVAIRSSLKKGSEINVLLPFQQSVEGEHSPEEEVGS